jgi:hypothetical protein
MSSDLVLNLFSWNIAIEFIYILSFVALGLAFDRPRQRPQPSRAGKRCEDRRLPRAQSNQWFLFHEPGLCRPLHYVTFTQQ